MPEQNWINEVIGDEARARTGFEDELARELHREWQGNRPPWRAVAWAAAAAAVVAETMTETVTRTDRPVDPTAPAVDAEDPPG